MMPEGTGHDRTQQVLLLLPEQEEAIVEDPGRELPVDLRKVGIMRRVNDDLMKAGVVAVHDFVRVPG